MLHTYEHQSVYPLLKEGQERALLLAPLKAKVFTHDEYLPNFPGSLGAYTAE